MRRVFVCLVLAFALAGARPAGALVGASAPSPDSSVAMVLSATSGHGGFCSAVVLAPDILLTAAHCVSAPATTRAHFRDAKGEPVLLAVEKIERHGGYRADAVAARRRSVDLALAKLAAPLPGRFHAVELGALANEAGAPLVLEGYGVTREGAGASGGVLRRADVRLRAPFSDLLLWLEGEGGACAGDSGGPVLSNGAVVGIIAFAAGQGARQCGGLTQAIRIAPYRDWIDGVLRRWRAP